MEIKNIGHDSTSGIQALNFGEIEQIGGGDKNADQLLQAAAFVAIGAAAVAAAPVLGASAVTVFGVGLAGRVLVAGGGLLAANALSN